MVSVALVAAPRLEAVAHAEAPATIAVTPWEVAVRAREAGVTEGALSQVERAPGQRDLGDFLAGPEVMGHRSCQHQRS